MKNQRSLSAAVTHHFRTTNYRAWLSILAIIVALGLNLHLYGGNYLHYGTLNPGMPEVLPKNALQYRITARETIFRLYTQEKITYMEALQMTGGIEHPGDKSDTFLMLMNYEKLKRNPQLWMGPWQYATVWIENMVGTVIGIKGHLTMFKDGWEIIPIYLVMLLSALGFVVRWRPRQSGWLPPGLALIACFYAGYLMYNINYNAYLYYGTPGITLQGRYLFPVYGPLCVLSCLYLLRLFQANYARVSLALAAVLLFIAYDFPWFLMHATPHWYEWMPRWI
jgi:hypothetical protein